MQKITPCLWFDGHVEEAAGFYVSLFPDARIVDTQYYMDDVHQPKGSILVMELELAGQSFQILNGGPHFKITPAISFTITCKDQAEVDHYWNAFARDGEEMPCGWVTDRFGVSWQVVPELMLRLLADPDRAKAKRAMDAMMKMKKFIVADIEKAARG